MKSTCCIILLLEFFAIGAACAASKEINLFARKDRVLPVKTRVEVLRAAEAYLHQRNDGFVRRLEQIADPYVFGRKVEESVPEVEAVPIPIIAPPVEVRRPVPAAPVVYSDASVLKVIAASFSKKVRGTLAKGERYYLQLQGGGLLKAGTSFAVKIPQLPEQSYTVVVSKVDARGYTLQMGQASLPMPLNSISALSSSAIQRVR
jgi:hypothetical protein